MDAAIIEKEALRLTTAERAVLADRLLQTLGIIDPAVEQAWSVEAEARLDAFLSGKETARDGREVLSEIRNSLR